MDEDCFSECDSLNSFTMTELEENKFLNEIKLPDRCLFKADSLEEIEFHANEINLGKSCFSGSKNLQKVALHSKNIIMDEGCFSDCNSLKSFALTELEKNKILNEIKLPDKCLFKAESLEEIGLTANEINLGSSCFCGSKKLQKIVLHSKKISIKDICFSECESLKTFIIPKLENDLITESLCLEDQCFLNSKNLEEIEISAKEINFYKKCFSGLKKLKKVVLHGKNIVLSDECFTGCDLLKSFIINEAVDRIYFGDQCFSNLKNFEEIEIKATEIGFNRGCFRGSNKLKKVVFRCKSIIIDKNCFTNCNKIETFQITGLESNETVETINLMSECFVNSNYIKEIELKANKIYVDDNCFKGATKLQKVLIDGTIVNIKNNCFSNCSSLKFFIVNALSSISIGSQQFIQCNQLNTINTANHNYQLKSFELNKDSFKGANNLSILEISGGNLSISNSSSLTELQINSANEVEIESNTFNNSKLKTIYIFSMKLTIKSNCFNNNSKLQNITFICPIIDIKNYCFNNINYCKQLEFKNTNQLTFESNNFCNLSLFESNDLINIEFQALEKIYIGPKSFYKLNKLEKIIFFSKQVKIENESFQKCSSLKSIHFISKIVMMQSQNITKTMEPKREKIKNVFIGEKSFNLCEKLEELNITAINEIHFGKECFYDLPKLKTIKLKASNIVYEDNCFYHCQGLTNNTTINKPNEEMLSNIRGTNIERKIEIKKDNREKPNINTLYKFENKFNSFFVLGVDSKKKRHSIYFNPILGI